jgi:hypothetical protein
VVLPKSLSAAVARRTADPFHPRAALTGPRQSVLSPAAAYHQYVKSGIVWERTHSHSMVEGGLLLMS